MASSVDFKAQLRRQLGFIERSCESYDKGSDDEAIRIATVLRVIFHNTRNSTSLLRHMGVQSVKILTQAAPIPANAVFADSIALIKADYSGGSLIPHLGRGHYKAFWPSDGWWTQLVYVRGDVRITRRDIILAAANKDGGAHVDSALTPAYEELMQGVWSTGEGPNETRIQDQQFILLRDAGYEILHSPDLIALAR